MPGNTIPFVRMNGIGNEIVIADIRGGARGIAKSAAIALSKDPVMHFDQIMEVADPASPDRDLDIRILNSDGSTAGACGNGTRCVVAWLKREMPKESYRFMTGSGPVSAWMDGGRIVVDMGMPRFGWQDIPLEEEFHDTTGIELQIGPIDAPVLHTPSVVNMGNPHAIFWVENDVNEYDLEGFGPLLENHPIFPDRANISIARIRARDAIDLRTWERGAGLTKACGSAACAALVCAVRKGYCDRSATVSLPGGKLFIEWNDKNRVMMSGPVEFEFSGELDPETGIWQRDAETEGA